MRRLPLWCTAHSTCCATRSSLTRTAAACHPTCSRSASQCRNSALSTATRRTPSVSSRPWHPACTRPAFPLQTSCLAPTHGDPRPLPTRRPSAPSSPCSPRTAPSPCWLLLASRRRSLRGGTVQPTISTPSRPQRSTPGPPPLPTPFSASLHLTHTFRIPLNSSPPNPVPGGRASTRLHLPPLFAAGRPPSSKSDQASGAGTSASALSPGQKHPP
mmetsp:Transcript_33677/g.108784  ORF Transcript_33677/g.108784 Transcript_33677/m.108784 type:complete len:215 (+) Transcript_33677:478-1122(+)